MNDVLFFVSIRCDSRVGRRFCVSKLNCMNVLPFALEYGRFDATFKIYLTDSVQFSVANIFPSYVFNPFTPKFKVRILPIIQEENVRDVERINTPISYPYSKLSKANFSIL